MWPMGGVMAVGEEAEIRALVAAKAASGAMAGQAILATVHVAAVEEGAIMAPGERLKSSKAGLMGTPALKLKAGGAVMAMMPGTVE